MRKAKTIIDVISIEKIEDKRYNEVKDLYELLETLPDEEKTDVILKIAQKLEIDNVRKCAIIK